MQNATRRLPIPIGFRLVNRWLVSGGGEGRAALGERPRGPATSNFLAAETSILSPTAVNALLMAAEAIVYFAVLFRACSAPASGLASAPFSARSA
jgi:hypothetical protein